VCDNWNFKKGTRKSINKDELKGTTQVEKRFKLSAKNNPDRSRHFSLMVPFLICIFVINELLND
jgi:hypothetical protein